nr:hypothetical protein [Tanacetum cinerariifolium]
MLRHHLSILSSSAQSDDQSCSDEDVLDKIVLKPQFEEEIIPMKMDQHPDNAKSDLMESLRTHDSSLLISSKIDSLLDEFAGELTLLKSIPSGIDETECDYEEDIRFIEKLLYNNSSPRPLEEFVSANSDAAKQATKAQNWKLPVCYDDDDDEESSNYLNDNIISKLPPYSAIITNEPIDSLSMGDEHLDTIMATESDEFIKSCVEKLVPNPKEIVSDNSNADIESFSPSPTPVEDSDSRMGEIDLPFNPNDPMPPSIEEDDDDSKRDIPILEELLDNYFLSLHENNSYHFDIPSSYRPSAKLPDSNTGTLNIKMMGDISEQKGLEKFQPSSECPMIINGKNTPLLDVPLFHFYPP